MFLYWVNEWDNRYIKWTITGTMFGKLGCLDTVLVIRMQAFQCGELDSSMVSPVSAQQSKISYAEWFIEAWPRKMEDLSIRLSWHDATSVLKKLSSLSVYLPWEHRATTTLFILCSIALGNIVTRLQCLSSMHWSMSHRQTSQATQPASMLMISGHA